MNLSDMDKKKVVVNLVHNAHWLARDTLKTIRRAKKLADNIGDTTELEKTARAILEEIK